MRLTQPAACPGAAQVSRGSLKLMRSTLLALAGAAALAGLLVGCSPTVVLDPAADATNPDCAKVIVALPQTVAELASRETDAQATGAWGEPTGVILRCGVPVPAPTATLPCVTVDGVDWLRDDSDAPNYVFTAYGRDPAVEVILDGEQTSGFSALNDLSLAVSSIPAEGACVSPEDTTQ